MRRIGYLAAAAGVVAPMALAIPASATPVEQAHAAPAAGGLLGDGLLGDDGLVGGLLDGTDPDEFEDDENGFDEPDDRDFGHDGDASVTVYTSDADRDGDVSIIVQGRDLPPLMNVSLSSAGLAAACVGGNTLDGATVQADLSGDFNVGATGDTCIDGTYRIDVTEQSTPYETFSAYVDIDS